MLEKLELLKGSYFVFAKLKYLVKGVKVITGNAVIITDRKTFNFLPSEFEDWYEAIDIFSGNDPTVVPERKAWIPEVIVPTKTTPLQAEVIVAESNAQKVSNKLMDIFDSLAGSPNEETYKKAAAMVNVSNSIVNVQMAQIKYLSLKK